MTIEISYSNELFSEVIHDTLVCANRLGEMLESAVSWSKCRYLVVGLPLNVPLRLKQFDKHVVPRLSERVIEETPNAIAPLCEYLLANRCSLLARDFALDSPHPRAAKTKAAIFDFAPHYYFDINRDSGGDLRDIVRFSFSWVFLGLIFGESSRIDISKLGADVAGRADALVFSIYGGDCFLLVDGVRGKFILPSA